MTTLRHLLLFLALLALGARVSASGAVCAYTSDYYLKSNCYTGASWPTKSGSTSVTCESENLPLCGTTHYEVMTSREPSNSGDALVEDLMREVIATELNKFRGVSIAPTIVQDSYLNARQYMAHGSCDFSRASNEELWAYLKVLRDHNGGRILAPACVVDTVSTGVNAATVPGPSDDDTDCTYTRGYWGTHNCESKNPSQLIQWPVNDTLPGLNVHQGNECAMEYSEYCGETLLSLLQQSSKGGDARKITWPQLIAAILNQANGASVPDEVQQAIDTALAILTAHCEGPITVQNSVDLLAAKDTLDNYNNGTIGPGHCGGGGGGGGDPPGPDDECEASPEPFVCVPGHSVNQGHCELLGLGGTECSYIEANDTAPIEGTLDMELIGWYDGVDYRLVGRYDVFTHAEEPLNYIFSFDVFNDTCGLDSDIIGSDYVSSDENANELIVNLFGEYCNQSVLVELELIIGDTELGGRYALSGDLTQNCTIDGVEHYCVRVDVCCIPPERGCTLTQGYWKTHNCHGYPSESNTESWPLWVPTEWEVDPCHTENQLWCGISLFDIMWTPVAGDAFYIFAHQYIAAENNLANGSGAVNDPPAFYDCITRAREIYAAGEICPGAELTDEQRQELIELGSCLATYNEGESGGPPHCDDVEPPLPCVPSVFQQTGSILPGDIIGNNITLLAAAPGGHSVQMSAIGGYNTTSGTYEMTATVSRDTVVSDDYYYGMVFYPNLDCNAAELTIFGFSDPLQNSLEGTRQLSLVLDAYCNTTISFFMRYGQDPAAVSFPSYFLTRPYSNNLQLGPFIIDEACISLYVDCCPNDGNGGGEEPPMPPGPAPEPTPAPVPVPVPSPSPSPSPSPAPTPTPEDNGCSLTQGYWKNHYCGAKNPSQNIPWPAWNDADVFAHGTSVGNCDTEQIMLHGETLIYVARLTKTKNPLYYGLAHQAIATTNSIQSGAHVCPEVLEALQHAWTLLYTFDKAMFIDKAWPQRSYAIDLMMILDNFNNGQLCGTPHCDHQEPLPLVQDALIAQVLADTSSGSPPPPPPPSGKGTKKSDASAVDASQGTVAKSSGLSVVYSALVAVAILIVVFAVLLIVVWFVGGFNGGRRRGKRD